MAMMPARRDKLRAAREGEQVAPASVRSSAARNGRISRPFKR
ncbi:MAG: hypothetical protein ACYC35_02980 [Pirellulales bacterium]